MERVKLEVELGREKDCNRVRKTTKENLLQSVFLVDTHFESLLQCVCSNLNHHYACIQVEMQILYYTWHACPLKGRGRCHLLS